MSGVPLYSYPQFVDNIDNALEISYIHFLTHILNVNNFNNPLIIKT